jgi:hypothetical protein
MMLSSMTRESPSESLLVDLRYRFVTPRIGKLERLERCDGGNYRASASLLMKKAHIWGQQ